MGDNVYLPEINKAGGWGTSEHGVEMFQKMRNHKGSLSTEREERERERERESERERETERKRERKEKKERQEYQRAEERRHKDSRRNVIRKDH